MKVAKPESNNGTDELSSFEECGEEIWTTPKVLNYLNALVRLPEDLDNLKSKSSEMFKELGYFSLVTLARAFVLFGDYYSSLSILKPIDFLSRRTNFDRNKRVDPLYEKVPACHISVFYHMGFAQMMLEKFDDAARSFSAVILQVHRSRNHYSRLGDSDQLSKLAEKALALHCIVLHLSSSQKVGEPIQTLLREKYADKQAKLQKGDMTALSELFSFACPKFIIPAVKPVNGLKDGMQAQMAHFSDIVTRQQRVPQLRSYVKLYRTIQLSKLARFQELGNKESVRAELMQYKLQSNGNRADVFYYLDDELVMIDEDVSSQRTGEFFMGNIHRFARLVDESIAE